MLRGGAIGGGVDYGTQTPYLYLLVIVDFMVLMGVDGCCNWGGCRLGDINPIWCL